MRSISIRAVATAPLLMLLAGIVPVLAAAPTFQGTWDSVTELNGHFVLTLSATGTGNGATVSGSFVNPADAQYNGTLSGALSDGGRKLQYSWQQPAVHKAGTGFFDIAPNSQRIGGVFFARGPYGSFKRYSWKATRLSN